MKKKRGTKGEKAKKTRSRQIAILILFFWSWPDYCNFRLYFEWLNSIWKPDNFVSDQKKIIWKPDYSKTGQFVRFSNGIRKSDHLGTDLISTIRNPDVSGFRIPTVQCGSEIWPFKIQKIWNPDFLKIKFLGSGDTFSHLLYDHPM